MTSIVYATSNPGKYEELKKLYESYGITLTSLLDYGVTQDVEESGDSLVANAAIKAHHYQKLLPKGSIVISDDTGLEIEALGGAPGIKVRRWKGYSMQDEEIIEHCLTLMKDVPQGKRGAKFHTVLGVLGKEQNLRYFHGYFEGEIMLKPTKDRTRGMPFFPLFYIPKLQLTLAEFHKKHFEFQRQNPTHRERAAIDSLPYLRELIHQG